MKEETIIIKLYDNEDYDYPWIEIKEQYEEQFRHDLTEYQKEDMYNIDEFIMLLEDKKYFVRALYFDMRIYF
jgi:allophanate hydrolase subunit 1